MNRNRIFALVALAGLATPALADHPISIPGPTNVTSAIGNIDLSGGTIPAGTYRQADIAFAWGNPFNDPYSTEAVFVFSSQATFPGGTVHINPGSGFGSYNDGGDANLQWRFAFDTAYNGGDPLFLLTQQTWAGSTADWTNIQINLLNAAPAIPAVNDTVPTITFATIGNPANVLTRSLDLAAAQNLVVKFTVPSGGLTASNGRYLDIDTEGSILAPTNDTNLAIYDSSGVLVGADDDDGSGLLSAISYGGSATPRTAIGTGVAGNGRDGLLASGDYYMFVSSNGDDFNEPLARQYRGFNYFNSSTNTTANPGDLKVNLRAGTVNPPVVLPCDFTETEANNTKATANAFTLANGQRLCGMSTGTTGTGSASYDYFKVKGPTPAAGQILRNRLTYTSATPTHTITLRGFTQTTGVINTAVDATIQTKNAGNNQFVQWYSMGTNPGANPDAYNMLVRAAGVTGSSADYNLEMAVDTVTPTDAALTLVSGSFTITTVGTTTVDTDIIVLDSNLNPISSLMNDDTDGFTLQSTVLGTLADGVYYIAVSNWNTGNNQASPLSDGYPDAPVCDFPGTMFNSSTAINQNVSLFITDATAVPQFVTVNKDGIFDVAFVKITVGNPVVNQRCQPADIACDDGTPLPADTGLHPNGGVNEGDYNSFFQGFFDAAANCDIANDDATPRAPFGANGVNGGVNEGDYNCFFQKFFDGCPA